MAGPLDHIIGHASAVAELRGALAAGRLPHAMIFAGPAGVGKATVATALAKIVLCFQPPAAETPCGKCPSCVAMDSGSHPDFHVVTRSLIRFYDKSGTSKGIEMSIEVVRPEVIERANMKSVLGRGRFFVVDEADTMTDFAANALLKTLEEPQGKSTFVLVTDAADSLPMTIRSRCRMVRFAAIASETVVEQLVDRNIDRQDAERAAALAGGSIGRAMQWLGNGVVSDSGRLMDMIDGLLAGRDTGELPQWFRDAADRYAEARMKTDPQGSKDMATRTGLAIYLGIVAERLRSELAGTNDPDRLSDLCDAIESTERAGVNIEANVNVTLALQQLSLALARSLSPSHA